MVLGLVLLGIVFLIPDGLIGLLRRWRGHLRRPDLAHRLHALADRIGGGPAGRNRVSPPAGRNGIAAPKGPASSQDQSQARQP